MVRNGACFAKTAFTLDWAAGLLHCPAGATTPFTLGTTVQFPAAPCAACPQRAQSICNNQGRSVTIHPDAALLVELRERRQTAAGRAALHERVGVEYALARSGQRQGDRARYLGKRNNLFDLRRMIVVGNFHGLMHLPDVAQAA